MNIAAFPSPRVRLFPLSQLRFGHEADPPINIRKTERGSEIEATVASIEAHGLIAPLVVKRIDDEIYVVDGNRRLAALRLLAERGNVAADATIECEELADGADAREISLAANIIRVPPHEADQLEAFSGLAADGMSEAEIAGRFGIDPKRVRRILAVGRLAPVILDAWRSGEFGNQPIECARAFTLAPTIKDQERVFAKLKKQRSLYAHTIRSEFGAGRGEAVKFYNLVGREAYEAAGGKVIEDLFGDNHVIADPALAKRLADEKLKAECERLITDGWSWAITADELPPGAGTWAMGRAEEAKGAKPTRKESARLKQLEAIIEDEATEQTDLLAAEVEAQQIQDAIETRKYDAAAKAKAGCVVKIGYRGELEITYGLLKGRPKPEKSKAGKDQGAGDKDAGPTVSNALMHRLSVQATQAAREALTEEPRVGLIALLAGFLSGGRHGDPIRVKQEGFGFMNPRGDGETFADAFARLSAMTDAELFQVAAGIAGQAVDMQCHHTSTLPFRNSNGVLADAIAADRMNQALREKFDAADYFNSVAKPLVVKAIAEAVNADEARKAGAMKKAELVAFAVKNVVGTGWLPPELRTGRYDGPTG